MSALKKCYIERSHEEKNGSLPSSSLISHISAIKVVVGLQPQLKQINQNVWVALFLGAEKWEGSLGNFFSRRKWGRVISTRF